jgi:Ca2+-binding EF-hand superfamily protein
MSYIKSLLIMSAIAMSNIANADDTATKIEEGFYHDKYHEPQHANDQAKHDKGTEDFVRADKNNDGTLSKKEAKKIPHISKHFDEIDIDKDGTVDRDEVHNFMKIQKTK